MDNINRWLGIAGLVIGLIGVWLAVRFYKKTVRSKLLAMGYTGPLPLILPHPELTITYRGSSQSMISRVFVLFWNRGTAPIEAEDFIEPIKVQRGDKVLGVSLFDKDVATSASINEEQRTLTIQLLRPGEALILQIDGTEGRYRPDISVLMKSADMTTSMGTFRAMLPYAAGVLVAGILAQMVVILPSTKLADEYGEWVYHNVGFLIALGHLGTACLIGLLTFFIVRKIVARSVSPVAARFFRLQTTAFDALPKWQSLKRKIERTTAR